MYIKALKERGTKEKKGRKNKGFLKERTYLYAQRVS
jgi:hypothetical protein